MAVRIHYMLFSVEVGHQLYLCAIRRLSEALLESEAICDLNAYDRKYRPCKIVCKQIVSRRLVLLDDRKSCNYLPLILVQAQEPNALFS